MAENITLARPYARAIFEIATVRKAHDKWSKILTLLSMIAKDPQAKSLLSDKKTPSQALTEFMFDVCGNFLDDQAKNLIHLLAKYRRLQVLPEINNLYEKMRAESENSVEVELFTAIPVSKTEEENFKILLEKYLSKTVKIISKIDKELLGGFVARAGNDVIDGSLKSRLTKLKIAMGG